MNKYTIGTSCRTGEICPESGVWKCLGINTTTIPLAKGNRFPPYCNKAVIWILVMYA